MSTYFDKLYFIFFSFISSSHPYYAWQLNIWQKILFKEKRANLSKKLIFSKLWPPGGAEDIKFFKFF